MGRSQVSRAQPRNRTEWQIKHVEKFREFRVFKDHESLESPFTLLAGYPSILAATEFVESLYKRFVQQGEQFKEMKQKGEINESISDNMRKRLRRKLAPHLLLGLWYLNLAVPGMSNEDKSKVEVRKWVAFFRGDLKRYYMYEPINSMYLPYLRKSKFFGGASTSHLNQASKALYGGEKFLLLALHNMTIPLDRPPFQLPDLSIMTVTNDRGAVNQHNIRKLQNTKDKLNDGIAEWSNVQRYVELFNDKNVGKEKELRMMELIVDLESVRKHIEEMEGNLELVDEELLSRQVSSLQVAS